ncbi:MAG: hypothetical protein J5858_12320 [Lentisphaeria bacterium]|nr:hypothetical protein [Lentisphaeria bacterium]
MPRQPLKTQKGGKISPGARRFPPSLFRETVKPPLFVPVLRDRLLFGCFSVYLVMFGTGELIYRKWLSGTGYLIGALIFAVLLVWVWFRRKKA